MSHARLDSKKAGKKYGFTFWATFVGVCGIFALVAIPSFVPVRTTRCKNTCINNLRQLDGAKEQYVMDRGAPINRLQMRDLCGPGKYLKEPPVCPAGGTYSIGGIGVSPSCTIAVHDFPE